MIPLYHLEGQKIAVFGLGRSGLSLARAAKAAKVDVVVYDGNEKAVKAAKEEGFSFVDLTKDRVWQEIDQLIISPGIPHLYPEIHPVIKAAYDHGVTVDNDVSLFFKELSESYIDNPPKVIAITGSNGKSTTSALIHHALVKLGFAAELGGNIGRGVFDLDPPQSRSVYVLELSSYQTELALHLSPDIAVFTNLSADHLDRHNGMGGYLAAKARLFTQSLPRSIIGVDEDEGLYLENRLTALGARVQAVSLGSKPAGRQHFFHVKKGFLAEWNKGRQAASVDLRGFPALPGAHNWQNAACAFGALRALNIAPREIENAMASFGGLVHRCQLLGEKDGIKIINDSKATNADAASHALAAFENIHWIAGGRAKEGGIESLREYFPKIIKTYLIGEAAEGFSKSLGDYPHEICGDLETAMKAIKANAKSGDIVLLSPACASFDQYPDFEKRGEAMISLAKSIFKV